MKKIIAPGRLKNRDEDAKLTSVYIDKKTLAWIEENTSGNKQLIFNYLLKKGIEHVESSETVIVEKL
jgi:hypothetical protein